MTSQRLPLFQTPAETARLALQQAEIGQRTAEQQRTQDLLIANQAYSELFDSCYRACQSTYKSGAFDPVICLQALGDVNTAMEHARRSGSHMTAVGQTATGDLQTGLQHIADAKAGAAKYIAATVPQLKLLKRAILEGEAMQLPGRLPAINSSMPPAYLTQTNIQALAIDLKGDLIRQLQAAPTNGALTLVQGWLADALSKTPTDYLMLQVLTGDLMKLVWSSFGVDWYDILAAYCSAVIFQEKQTLAAVGAAPDSEPMQSILKSRDAVVKVALFPKLAKTFQQRAQAVLDLVTPAL